MNFILNNVVMSLGVGLTISGLSNGPLNGILTLSGVFLLGAGYNNYLRNKARDNDEEKTA